MGEIADDCYDRAMDEALDGDSEYSGGYYTGRFTPRQPHCTRCGSANVRWRQQTGRWVLFSDKPGVEHVCASSTPDADGFSNEGEK